MIHETDDGRYVISTHGCWLPGNYADKRAANYAFRFDDKQLWELQERINYLDTGEGRPITFEDLQKLRN
jgi:hypothetical protein